MKRREAWKDYVEYGQNDRAVWWLMHCRSFSRRAAEAHVANYVKNEMPKVRK